MSVLLLAAGAEAFVGSGGLRPSGRAPRAGAWRRAPPPRASADAAPLAAEAGAVFVFASTHIGLSAVREVIITKLGEGASTVGLVGRGWRLPESWQGDSSGNGSAVLPDAATAGSLCVRACRCCTVASYRPFCADICARGKPPRLTIRPSQDANFFASSTQWSVRQP